MPPGTQLESNGYWRLAYYDRPVTSPGVAEYVPISQTLVGSASSQPDYNKSLADLFGFGETSSVSATPVDALVRKPTDEELWLRPVGLFFFRGRHPSGPPDQMYGARK